MKTAHSEAMMDLVIATMLDNPKKLLDLGETEFGDKVL